MAIPFPQRPFEIPPQVFPAERHFEFIDQDNNTIEGYLRRAHADHPFAYTSFGKPSHGRARDGRRTILTGAKYVPEGDGRYRFTNEYVVIKKLSKEWIRRNPHHPENVRTELAAATLLEDDEHVHRIIEVLEDSRFLYIVMPSLGLDVLDTFSHRRPTDMVQFTRAFTRAAVNDLIYIKQHRVIHRDISLENIIVEFASQGRICLLIDFAMSLRCAEYEGNVFRITPQRPPCGKLRYMSPEVWFMAPLDFGVDVWALGCVFFYIFTMGSLARDEFRGIYLYDMPGDRCWEYYLEGNGLAEARQRNFDQYVNDDDIPADDIRVVRLLPVVQSLSDVQRDLLCQMLDLNPANRIAAEDILQHPYFQ